MPPGPDDPETLMVLLGTAWTRPEWTPAQITHYATCLGDVPRAELAAAVRHLVLIHETWRPDVALIRRTVVEARGLFPSLPEATRSARELAEVRALYRANGSATVFPIVHPVARDALDAAGSDSPASYAKAYRELVTTSVQGIQAAALDRPVVFHPIRVAHNHTPPELVWHHRGWRTPTGVLVHPDHGDRPSDQLPADSTVAIGSGG